MRKAKWVELLLRSGFADLGHYIEVGKKLKLAKSGFLGKKQGNLTTFPVGHLRGIFVENQFNSVRPQSTLGKNMGQTLTNFATLVG